MKLCGAFLGLFSTLSCIGNADAFARPSFSSASKTSLDPIRASFETSLHAIGGKRYGPCPDHTGAADAGCPCCNGQQFDIFGNKEKLWSARDARILAPTAASSLFAGLSLPQLARAEDRQIYAQDFARAAKYYFPGSLPTSTMTKIISEKLTEGVGKEPGSGLTLVPENTLMATSICPDEINLKPDASLAWALQRTITNNNNGAFALGGLAGLPFSGVSGMKAFLSHCPIPEDGGNIFLFFGPHIGISDGGAVGKVERLGVPKEKLSTACGAAIGAYNAISANPKIRPTFGDRDYQEDLIIARLQKILEDKETDPMRPFDDVETNAMPAYVTHQMYEIIEAMLLDEVLSSCWGGGGRAKNAGRVKGLWDRVDKIVLLGGVIINRGVFDRKGKEGVETEDYFQPLLFQAYSRPPDNRSAPRMTDLFDKTFIGVA